MPIQTNQKYLMASVVVAARIYVTQGEVHEKEIDLFYTAVCIECHGKCTCMMLQLVLYKLSVASYIAIYDQDC